MEFCISDLVGAIKFLNLAKFTRGWMIAKSAQEPQELSSATPLGKFRQRIFYDSTIFKATDRAL